eukprot:jgi/Chrzof1/1556/Cz10g12100.t1
MTWHIMKIVLGLTAVSAIHLLLYPCQATGSNLPRVAQHSFSEPIHSPQYNSVQSIIEDCYNYLQSHECIGSRWRLDYHFYRPSLQKYSPHQWLWDSGAHMIVWSHRNVSNSIADLRTMLQLQPPDGFIPEMIFWGLEDMPWWKRQLDAGLYSNKRHTDITQMPNLPFALRAIWNKTQDVQLLQEFTPALVRYFDWWAATRDVDGNGLVAIIHGWESGIDASPAYDAAYGITDPHPSSRNIYPRFIKLLLSYKLMYEWNVDTILARRSAPWSLLDNWFVVFDVGLNSVYAAGWGVLAELADRFNTSLAAHCRSRQAVVEQAIIKHCWDDKLQRFLTLYKDRQGATHKSPVETTQSLFPLLLKSLPQSLADSLVHHQLLNTTKFWSKYPIPSTAMDATQYEPGASRLMWRGPVWPMLNWIIMEGLVNHGYTQTASDLLDRWTQLYQASGVWEQYNPETGAAFGTEGLGMSTLIVDWLYRLGRVGHVAVQ